jgi:hypothetical protein
VIVIGFVAPLDDQRRAQRVQLLRRLFLRVAAPAAMAAEAATAKVAQVSWLCRTALALATRGEAP